MPVGHLYGFFEEMSVHVFCPFLDWIILWVLSLISSFFFNFYLFMIVTEREREVETQAEGEAGSL